MKDYQGVISTAQRLVANFGKTIDVVKFSAASIDPAKPWLQSASPNTTSVSVIAVQVPATGEASLGIKLTQSDLTKSPSLIYICAPTTEELDGYHAVRDGGIEYKINGIEKLRPANDTLLYYLMVSR